MPKKNKYTIKTHPIHAKKKKISPVYDNLKGVIGHNVARRIREKYEAQATPHEKKLIDDMLGLMTDPLQVAHFFLGGHIELHGDDGKYYQEWIEYFNKPMKNEDGKEFPAPLKYRASSHISHGEKQGSFTTPVLHHVLFSTRKEDPHDPVSKKYTWVQLENKPIKSVQEWRFSPTSILNEICNAILHFLDFLKYKITGRNIGAYGTSEYTENKPLKINILEIDLKNSKTRATLWKEVILDKRGMNIDDVLIQKMKNVGIKFPHKLKPAPEI